MGQFPSSIEYASLLQYSPRGVTDISKDSRTITYLIKQDGVFAGRRVIDYAAEVIEQELRSNPFLTNFLGQETTLIPVPRSSPQRSGALWPPLRISQALLARNLGREILPCLKRKSPVRKASTSAASNRPDPPDHYASLGLVGQQSFASPTSITLIDDVITRGSSFLGAYPHIQAAFPGIPIRCFAIVRTESTSEVDSLRAPCSGVVTYNAGQCLRRP